MTVRLVSPAPAPRRPSELDALVRLVETHAPRPGDVVPADPSVLASLWSGPAPSPATVQSLVARAVATGQLRTLVLGREPHLALPAAPSPPIETAPAPGDEPVDASKDATAKAAPSDTAPEGDDDGGRVDPNAPTPVRAQMAAGAFDAQVAVDMERERILLYRVALVVEGIVALVAIRGLVLGFLGL